jgi:SAM-dependent methyltransferase
MPDVSWNLATWGNIRNWDLGGEEWSASWGSSESQWFGSLYPRIHRLLPARSIMEIAPGFGRWTRFLLPLCQNYIGVDLSSICVSHCQRAFDIVKYARFIENDGYSLKEVAASSIDFVFSFDSLVHAEFDVFESYIPQILRQLTPTGAAFLHHSNLAYFNAPTVVESAGRSLSVSADKVAELIRGCGGRVLIQEMINWHDTAQLRDCMTIFMRRESTFEDCQSGAIRLINPRFMDEATLIKSYHRHYSGLRSAPDPGAPDNPTPA